MERLLQLDSFELSAGTAVELSQRSPHHEGGWWTTLSVVYRKDTPDAEILPMRPEFGDALTAVDGDGRGWLFVGDAEQGNPRSGAACRAVKGIATVDTGRRFALQRGHG